MAEGFLIRRGGTSDGITDVSTTAEMNALLVDANAGKMYRFVGTTDEYFTNGDLYEVEVII